MRIIDADKLIEYIKHSNLEFIPSNGLVKCLEEIINKQQTISKLGKA
ncbi:hypothetical protein [Clostridium estertheticum]|nr:hypothetical protein [Clostridium estertheticum]MBU3186591.1 hypothetical protein [Clostridium estertheticum]